MSTCRHIVNADVHCGFPQFHPVHCIKTARGFHSFEGDADTVPGFVDALNIAENVLAEYKHSQPKWWRRMDGTPILNDVAVRMALAFAAHAPSAPALAPQAESFEEVFGTRESYWEGATLRGGQIWDAKRQVWNYCRAHAPSAPAGTAPTPHGNLWLAYHALSDSEWEFVNNSETGPLSKRHSCAYCGNSENAGHDKDCMIGNALAGMEEFVAEARASAMPEEKR